MHEAPDKGRRSFAIPCASLRDHNFIVQARPLRASLDNEIAGGARKFIEKYRRSPRDRVDRATRRGYSKLLLPSSPLPLPLPLPPRTGATYRNLIRPAGRSVLSRYSYWAETADRDRIVTWSRFAAETRDATRCRACHRSVFIHI